MSLPIYLALTATEFPHAVLSAEKPAYMACHFSPYGTGLSNLPARLPSGSLLIVNDRIPLCGHDPERISAELGQLADGFSCDGVLLDFQRKKEPLAQDIALKAVSSLPCPVAVTEHYGKDLDCPVFIWPSLYIAVEETLRKWQGREIWLELALCQQKLTLTEDGCGIGEIFPYDRSPGRFYSPELACRYTSRINKRSVEFTLSRDADCLHSLLEQAQNLGVTRAVGLYQELANFAQENDYEGGPSGRPFPTRH